MARYKLIGNELVDITNKNKTNSTPTPYKIAQNKDKMLTQINHRKTNDSTTMYKIENEFKLRNEVNKNRRKYIDSKNILADTLNNQGLNVNRNNPFQANVNSNNLINNSRTNLNGIVTLNDVVNNQKKVLENNKELVNNVNNSMSDYAKSNYLYNKQKVDNDNVSLYDKTLGTAVRGVSDLFSNIITPTSYIIDENGRKVKAPTYNELKQSKVSENYNTGVGKFLGDATYNMSKILGSQAINAVTGGVGGTALYWSDMFFDNYHSSVRDGHDNNNAMAYALASTAAEYLTGKFLGSATKQLTGGKTNEYEKLLDKVFTRFISNKNVTTFLSNAGSEATEEFIQEYLDNINKNLILGENNKVFSLDTLADAAYSAGLGAISGGTIGVLNSKIYRETPDTNVIPNDISENIEEKKSKINSSSNITENGKNINSNDIKTSIDSKIDINTEMENITNEINEYQQLRRENKLTSKQEQYLNQLKQKLNELQNTNTYIESSSPTRQILPTVQDIVNQEQMAKNTSINLPVDNQQSIISNMNNANSEILSSNKKILPTINDFNGSNINIPTNNIKVDMTKIKPEILEDIKGFKLGDPNIESYKGSYIKTMLNEVGIKVPNAMNYVSEVMPDISFTTTKDLTRQQYASVSNALQKLRSVDVTGINNINDVAVSNNILPIDVSQINQTKGNIPINQELLNKYKSTNEMFRDSINNYNGEVNVKDNLFELQNVSVENMKIGEVKKLAKEIFQKYNKSNTFYNSNNKILVNKTGIDESITKIFESRQQRELLKEHLLVFSDLGDIIEHSKLVNQVPETKGREKYNSWNYYYDGLKIGNNSYNFEFEVVSMSNGENHYRVQKLEKISNKKTEISTGSTKSTLPVSEIPVSDNNIPQINENVKLPIVSNNDMQNNENNTNNLLPTKEYFESKENNETKEPEKLAEILKEKPNTIEEKDNWLKKLATIKFIDKGYYVDKLARKVKNKELSSKYDYSLLSNGIANQIIGNGRVDEKGNKVGKGLYEIFEPIENSGLLDEFSNYIYHKHNIDRMSLQNRFNEANKAIFGDSMTSEMSEKIVNEYETKYPEFESWADDIYEYNNANLEMLVKYGVLSKDSMEYYNKKYPHYVPTIREQTKTKTQMDFLLGKKASVNNPIKKAKGGNGNIIPLKDAMALRTMQTVNSALRNNFGLELLNSIETEQIRNQENIDNIVEEINSDELLAKSSDTSPATLTVFDKGEKVTFDISDEIYEALKPSNIKTFKFLNKLNNIRRGLLTEYNPTFMITNPLKDIQDGSINSKHPKLFIKNLPEAIKQIKNNGQYKQLYIANGGSYETYFNYNTGTNIAPSKLDKIAPLKKISEINELIEMAPRLAEFISSIEAGDSIETAMYNASEITTNFKRGGDITKTLDRNGVTFLNAGVQGTTKQVRNVQEARVEGIKGITRLAVRWTIAGLVPTLLMNMIWGDDDDYEELSDYVKNNYYIIGKYDNGEFIRIPKGRVISVLQSFFQNVLNGANGKEIDLKGFADLIENNLLPSDPNESSLIAPIKQAINNETWYGGDLVPTRLQNLPNAEQYDESTDSISIWLGKQLNISPYKINYVLDQYSGAIGDYILPYLTQEAESGNDSFTGKLIAPVKDKFTVDSTLKNQNISDFYSLSEKLTKKSNSSNATDEDILKNKYINSIKSEISKLYAEKREIQSSSSLKDSDKYNQSKELQKQINELSKTALNNYKNIEITDNYAIVGNKEYYKNSNDEWTKIDIESPKYKIANLITKYNNYLKYNDEIKNIKNQYDNSNTRKNAVIKYVNSLDLTIPQKAMLIKMNYSSYNDYNNQIINYINKQSISLEDKKEILKELGFKVRNGKVYTK